MTAFGDGYGMAFQIVDDVLDVTATSEQLGKPAGHDLVEGVYSLPVLRALAGPEGDELRTLLGKPIEGVDVERARQLVQRGTAVDEAIDEARGWCGRAVASVSDFADRPGAVALVGVADHLTDALVALRG
jgi:geranylgeranyl pyrophosphate synthase